MNEHIKFIFCYLGDRLVLLDDLGVVLGKCDYNIAVWSYDIQILSFLVISIATYNIINTLNRLLGYSFVITIASKFISNNYSSLSRIAIENWACTPMVAITSMNKTIIFFIVCL